MDFQPRHGTSFQETECIAHLGLIASITKEESLTQDCNSWTGSAPRKLENERKSIAGSTQSTSSRMKGAAQPRFETVFGPCG
jgi:hypothetical protein